jgi:hypothetical protein
MSPESIPREWEELVPPIVADMIKAKNLFGYRTTGDERGLAAR